MKITKLGHSCLLVEENEARILLDPGCWSVGHTELINIDAIFLTHEHADHTDPESLKKILALNPQVNIYSNDGVIAVLAKAGIVANRCVDGDRVEIKGVPVHAHGKDHAFICDVVPRVQNTGYLVGGRLFSPGDSFFIPPVSVEVLALPVCAPWLKMSESVDYVTAVKPVLVFPIHDAMLQFIGPFHRVPKLALEDTGIKWAVFENNQPYDAK